MNRILLFCALGALLGCRPTAEPSGGVITLSYVASEQSKTDALTAGDEVAVFARVEGTESYFLECEKFVTGSDGRTLSTSPAVYYPETKQAVAFYAYFPYHTGSFSVPSDQSTATALKQADLCWATAQSTPVTVVPLEFRHLFARLVVTTNEPTERIACQVVPSGVLNAATAEFSLNSTKSEVFTSGNELILPAQPLTRLVLTVSGVEYVLEQNITLEAGKTTSLHLTLNTSTHTASLSSSNTTDWTAVNRTGDPNSPIHNQLKLHWAAPHVAYALADKVTLTLENPITKATQTVDVVPALLSDESSAAACAYTLPLSLGAGSEWWYPCTITQAQIYQGPTLLRAVGQGAMKGTTLYRSGAQTVAISTYIQVRDAATNTTDVREWLNVDKDFGSMLVKVTTVGCDNWTAVVEGGDGVNIQPSSGTSGQVVRINWSPNLTASARTGRVIKFSPTGVATAFTPVQTSQNAGPSSKAVLINGVYWATGNLVADGTNGCKIGSSTDCGLYFQFGSLIGWSGGAAPNYDGTGTPTHSTATVKVKPANLNPTYDPGSTWPTGGSTTTLDKPYFSIQTAPYTTVTSIDSYASDDLNPKIVDTSRPDLIHGRYAPAGVGDPCRYYLGADWRTPSRNEAMSTFGIVLSDTWQYGVLYLSSTSTMFYFSRDGGFSWPASASRNSSIEFEQAFTLSQWNTLDVHLTINHCIALVFCLEGGEKNAAVLGRFSYPGYVHRTYGRSGRCIKKM